ncbi:hypothetical protein HanHA300_Chr03g0076701 [Helianthus annuus]|nr:hypothetical protein HanHA300_Chr03g0076701 [Helianthus annuus]
MMIHNIPALEFVHQVEVLVFVKLVISSSSELLVFVGAFNIEHWQDHETG